MKVQKGNSNVYLDLGTAEASEMLVKAELATEISWIIRHRRLLQQEAAKLIHISQPKLSKLLRGNFQDISVGKMLQCLTRLGCDVSIVVKQRREPRAARQASVVIA